MKQFLEKHKDHLLAEAKSEMRNQECRADFLDSSVRDLQRQLDSNRLEIYCTNQTYEESRKRERPDFMKNSFTEKEYFEKLKSEVFMKWEN